MIDKLLTRRAALFALGGAAAGAVGGHSPSPQPPPAPRADAPHVDSHVHLVNSKLPGGLPKPIPLAPFPPGDSDGPAKLARAFEADATAAGVSAALVMPRLEVSDADPLGIRDVLTMAGVVRGVAVHPVGLMHPERFDRDHLDRVEEVLKRGVVKALKGFLGYLHYVPLAVGYRRYFPLAAKYKIPVIFHCGDTYSRAAKVKFAHPLLIDEAAVDFPDNRFVIAHFGNPWLADAAQVVMKNKNVWADLSAILIGSAAAFAGMEKDGVVERTVKRVKEALEFADAPERFLFGSDWPLSPIPTYRDFVRRLFAPADHAGVCGGNAKALFGV
jgi:predicted TIM-barrel fold metal-dependent hydrolase